MKVLAKNPLTSGSTSVTDISAWTGGILWVVMFGAIMAMGTKLLSVIDAKVPGNQTPKMAPYIQPVTGSGLNVL
jgi:hypothetical protein